MKPGQVATVECMGTTASAWLSPRGIWHYTGECGHYDAACAILAELGVDVDGYDDEPVDMLEARGWVHISYGEIIFTRIRMTSACEGAIADAMAHIERMGAATRHLRYFMENARYVI